MFFKGEEDAVPRVDAVRTRAPCASSPGQEWGVAGFLKAPLFGVSNTITTAAYGPGQAATGSTTSMPTGDDTGCVSESSDKGTGVLCVSWCMQQHRHCRPAMVRGIEQHGVGPTTTPPHGPSLVCFIHTLFTLPTHTHVLGSQDEEKTLQRTREAQTLYVLPGCNGPDPLLPPQAPCKVGMQKLWPFDKVCS